MSKDTMKRTDGTLAFASAVQLIGYFIQRIARSDLRVDAIVVRDSGPGERSRPTITDFDGRSSTLNSARGRRARVPAE
jgi:hypothetical protein